MRVIRIETDRAVRASSTRAYLRKDRFGAFNWDNVDAWLLNSTPGPLRDFELDLYSHPNREDIFFAFPPETFSRNIDYIGTDVIAAEYDVEPLYKSQHQVIFHRASAKFISETRVGELRTNGGINDTRTIS